jgi:hypothetical protein
VDDIDASTRAALADALRDGDEGSCTGGNASAPRAARSSCASTAGRGDDGNPTQTLTTEWIKPSSTRRREVLQPESSEGPAHRMAAGEQKRPLRAIATARLWLDGLAAGVVPDLATLALREDKSERWVRMTLLVGFLDPALIKAAAQGQLHRRR